MREPSLHITEKNLALVLERVFGDDHILDINYKELAKQIVYQSRNLSCNNRVVKITNERLEKKTKQILVSNKSDALLLSDLIYMIRKKKKHRGIKKLVQGDKDWLQVKKLTEICIDFCNDFELEKRQGFITYLEMAFSKITSTRQYLSKFINMSEGIAQEYEFVQEIAQDENPTETREIHDTYINLIATRTGIPEPYDKNPSKYIYFKRVRELTDKLDIPFDIFLKAQFEGLAWADAFPEPNQLVGDRSMERLNKYMYNKKIKIKGKNVKKDKDTLSGVLKGIKNGKDRNK